MKFPLWPSLFVVFSIVAIFFPWALVSAIGCLVVTVLQHTTKEAALKEAIDAQAAAKAEWDKHSQSVKRELERIEEIQSQVDNIRAAQNMSLGRRQ